MPSQLPRYPVGLMRCTDREARMAAVRARCLGGVMLVALLLASCRDSGTALYVTVELPSSLQVDQLRVSGTVEGSGIGPHLLPEQPERQLESGETFRVLLPSAPEGAQAELLVEGLYEGTRVAFGTGRVEVHDGQEVDVTVRLEASTAPPDGGPFPDGGTQPDAGTPDGGGFCPNCADGCCMNGFCTKPTFNTCGTGGIACAMCDPRTANACAPAGFCACGSRPACDAFTTDRCENGQCKCGGGSACGPGQECVAGRCVCTNNSCSGCCNGSTCEPGNEQSKCGTGGAACRKCNRACLSGGICG